MKCKSISRKMSDENKSLSHLVLLGLAFLFGCALWAIVNFDVYSRLSGKALHHEILSDLIMKVAETVLRLNIFFLASDGTQEFIEEIYVKMNHV